MYIHVCTVSRYIALFRVFPDKHVHPAMDPVHGVMYKYKNVFVLENLTESYTAGHSAVTWLYVLLCQDLYIGMVYEYEPVYIQGHSANLCT